MLRLIIAAGGDNSLVDKARKKVIVPIVIQRPESELGAPTIPLDEEEDTFIEEEELVEMEEVADDEDSDDED